MSLEESDRIAAEGAEAPRVSIKDIDDFIVRTHVFTAGAAVAALGQPTDPCSPMDLLTICVLTLKNGYTIVGTSACASPANFDRTKGVHFALEDAKRQMWPLMGFSLRDRLDRQVARAIGDVDYATRV